MVIKTCSCFIDRAVWFINLSDTAPRFWYFDSTINYSKNKRDAFLNNDFIKEVRTTKTVLDDDEY